MSDYGKNPGPKEGIWLRNRVMPLLPEIAAESFKSHVGRRLEMILEARGHRRRERLDFRTPRGVT